MDNEQTIELREILQHFDLGELATLEKNERGFVNTSFAIDTVRDGQPARYFLRKYKRGIREEEIQFEHSVIEHLLAAGSPPVARIHPTHQGKTYYRRFEGEQDEQGIFYAIFDYLPGEDRYTWVGPNCTDEELRASAQVLAQYHSAVSRLTPKGRRAEPKILELLPVIARNAAGSALKSKQTAFDDCLEQDLPEVQANLHATLAALNEPQAVELPQVIIHCDFHPGNLKYEGQQVVGLFDFDWSKLDTRAFDVGLALWYFCASWEASQDGELRLGQVKTFLSAYQETLRSLSASGGIGPLSRAEGKYLAHMISAGNLYIFNWTIDDYFAKDVDPQEYLVYLRHSTRFCRWFQGRGNWVRLDVVIQSVV